MFKLFDYPKIYKILEVFKEEEAILFLAFEVNISIKGKET